MQKQLENWDKSFLWHPFTQMQDWEKESICVIARGQGVYLIDTDGNRYLDGISSMWTNVHGHNHPRLNAALTAQIEKISHSTLLGFSNIPAIQLAKRLVEITPPGLNRTFFSDNGSTAVEIALKIAHQYWRHCGQENRSKFVHLDQAYHGDTLGAVSVGGIDLFHQTFAPLTFSSISTPTPNAYKGHLAEENRDRCLDLLDQILTRHQGQISGIIVEPLVQGAGGMIIHPTGFLKGVEQLARKYDVLLIVDEVMTGLGRTGQMWACQREQVEPDILCSAKGLTAGYLPLAATLTTEKIYTAFLGEYAELKTFFHGHSFTGNQLGATVALANLELFDTPDFFSQLENKIAYFQQRLQEFHTLDYVGNLRSIGLIAAFELMSDKRKQIEFPFEQKAGIRVCRSALKKGVILRPLVNTIVLMPPLSITTSEIDLLIDGVWSAVNQTGRELVAETQLLRHN